MDDPWHHKHLYGDNAQVHILWQSTEPQTTLHCNESLICDFTFRCWIFYSLIKSPTWIIGEQMNAAFYSKLFMMSWKQEKRKTRDRTSRSGWASDPGFSIEDANFADYYTVLQLKTMIIRVAGKRWLLVEF